jgi:general secretion pathway protein K
MTPRNGKCVLRGQMKRERRGVALIVVLWAVALMATVTAIATQAARESASVAANVRAQSTARSMAESGVVAATALIDDSLRVHVADRAARDAYLGRLAPNRGGTLPLLQDTLDDGVFAVTVWDINAQLDINNAGVDGLARLFGTVTTPAIAQAMAERIDGIVRGHEGAADDPTLRARDSLAAALLGRDFSPRQRRPFQSLDALRDVSGLDQSVLNRLAPLLTVDGDGNINRRSAPREVLASASGSLVDAPTRLLVIARGWYRGHPLAREIEAVYDIASDGLRLVRWRERDL